MWLLTGIVSLFLTWGSLVGGTNGDNGAFILKIICIFGFGALTLYSFAQVDKMLGM